jgi:hypothetical protein
MAGDEPVVAGLRARLTDCFRPAYEHVAAIHGPVRRVTAGQLKTMRLPRPDAAISVVGTLTDHEVHALLEVVGDGVAEATRVTGDQRFAVVQIGDPRHDPCCTTTVLFENRSEAWTNLGAITSSH